MVFRKDVASRGVSDCNTGGKKLINVFCGERPTNRIKTSMVNINKMSHNIKGICRAKQSSPATRHGGAWGGEAV
jgi:hypothetical protein